MSRRITASLTAAAVTMILATGGASGRNGPGQQPPRNVTPPSINGTAQVPNPLSATNGTWQGRGLRYAYQWLRCDSAGANCNAISGVTASTDTLSAADVGNTLRVIVTASNRNGSAAATSAQTDVVGTPEPPPPPAPPGVPPTDVTPPTATGTAQQGQTLVGATGTWSGSTPIGYAYQWQRCDSGGASCAAISGATAANYTLVAADVGRRMRVSVAASNSYGSTAAASDATEVVGGPPPDGHYYSEYLDSAFSNSFWTFEPSGALTWVDGVQGQGARLTNCASASATNHCTTSGSRYGQVAVFDVTSRPSVDHPHTGRILGSGTNCCDGNGSEADTWYRFGLRFPTGYQATPGTQNAVFEFHVDDKTAAERAALGYGNAYSTLIDVQGDGTSCSGTPPFCTTPATSARLFMQVPGGPINAPDSQTLKRYFPLPSGSLLTNHWYDVVLHVHWSSDPTNGWVQWWLDGAKILDVHTATLYTRLDGTRSYAENLGGYNYRLWASWPSSVDFDELVWGPTAASVGQ